MARPRMVRGFDYVNGCADVKTLGAWKGGLSVVEAAGGYCKRVKGDMTAFSASGKMLFEYYDQDKPQNGAEA